MTKKEFIETFAHFMSEHDLNAAYKNHFNELGYMGSDEIKKWLVKVLQDDNPPLSFDELEKGMWVWDDKNKLYVQVDNDFNEGNGFIIIRYHEDSYNSNCERVQFEENRFYRRQKED